MYTTNLDSLFLIQITSIVVFVTLAVGQITSYAIQGTNSPLVRNKVVSNLIAIATGFTFFAAIVSTAFAYIASSPNF